MIRCELIRGDVIAAKRTFFRAIHRCPSSKDLWLDAWHCLRRYGLLLLLLMLLLLLRLRLLLLLPVPVPVPMLVLVLVLMRVVEAHFNLTHAR
jgi:hypothetical protein